MTISRGTTVCRDTEVEKHCFKPLNIDVCCLLEKKTFLLRNKIVSHILREFKNKTYSLKN